MKRSTPRKAQALAGRRGAARTSEATLREEARRRLQGGEALTAAGLADGRSRTLGAAALAELVRRGGTACIAFGAAGTASRSSATKVSTTATRDGIEGRILALLADGRPWDSHAVAKALKAPYKVCCKALMDLYRALAVARLRHRWFCDPGFVRDAWWTLVEEGVDAPPVAVLRFIADGTAKHGREIAEALGGRAKAAAYALRILAAAGVVSSLPGNRWRRVDSQVKEEVGAEEAPPRMSAGERSNAMLAETRRLLGNGRAWTSRGLAAAGSGGQGEFAAALADLVRRGEAVRIAKAWHCAAGSRPTALPDMLARAPDALRYRILRLLAEGRATSLGEIVASCGSTRHHCSVAIKDLVRNGSVRRIGFGWVAAADAPAGVRPPDAADEIRAILRGGGAWSSAEMAARTSRSREACSNALSSLQQAGEAERIAGRWYCDPRLRMGAWGDLVRRGPDTFMLRTLRRLGATEGLRTVDVQAATGGSHAQAHVTLARLAAHGVVRRTPSGVWRRVPARNSGAAPRGPALGPKSVRSPAAEKPAAASRPSPPRRRRRKPRRSR